MFLFPQYIISTKLYWWLFVDWVCLSAFSSLCLGPPLTSPSVSPRLPPTSSSQPPWLTAVTTCCANWKRPWLVLFPNRSGRCPVVFPSAGGWQLAFQLWCSAAWTPASQCRALASPLSVNTRPGPKPHWVGENCRLGPFLPAALVLNCNRHLWGQNLINKWKQCSGC